MSTGRESGGGDGARVHPRLPGKRLETLELGANGEICLFDGDNPEAYVIGKAVELGTPR